MRVMKQQAVIALNSMVRADSPDQGRVIPFVNDDEIDPIERAIQIGSCRIVKGTAQAGIALSNASTGAWPRSRNKFVRLHPSAGSKIRSVWPRR